MLCDDLNVKEIQNRGDIRLYMGFPGGSAGKELPAMQETRLLSLGWEDPLEKGIATYSSILAWRIPRIVEEPDRPESMGSQRVRHDSNFH